MGLICTYIFQSFVYSCNVRYSTKKKNKSCQRCPKKKKKKKKRRINHANDV